MAVAPEHLTYYPGETYLEVGQPILWHGRDIGTSRTVYVSAHAKLSLNGSYLARVEIDRGDIARLFFLAYGHRETDDIVRLIAAFKEEEQRRAAAVTVPKEEARKAIVAQWLLRPAAERANMQQAYEFVMQALDRYSWPENRSRYSEAMAWIIPHIERQQTPDREPREAAG
jgi:hypothetical protein